jgi:hypothetical protein
MNSLISEARNNFHRSLIENNTLCFSKFNKFGETKIASNADSGQKSSVLLSVNEKKKDGQTTGNDFEAACGLFLKSTFPYLQNLRPGKWEVLQIHQRNESVLGRFEQYSHLYELSTLAQENKVLRNFLGDGYTIAPDVIISRNAEPDDFINKNIKVVDDSVCKNTMLRLKNHEESQVKPLLHASISCKFTMRSDRAQNTRTEALNLIRTRKGRTPHIVAVTAEPTSSRLASLALGTGDMDHIYHFALYELLECYKYLENDEALDLLNTMIDGKRLRDISDLPLDLSI